LTVFVLSRFNSCWAYRFTRVRLNSRPIGGQVIALPERESIMRLKRMPKGQFLEVMKLEWAPVQLSGRNIPDFLQGIPENTLHSVYASGTHLPGFAYSDESIPSGSLIGGIEVYRNAPSDPVELNKDWYAVVTSPNADSMLLVVGPNKDAEHWLNEIPKRLTGAAVWAVPAKPDDFDES